MLARQLNQSDDAISAQDTFIVIIIYVKLLTQLFYKQGISLHIMELCHS